MDLGKVGADRRLIEESHRMARTVEIGWQQSKENPNIAYRFIMHQVAHYRILCAPLTVAHMGLRLIESRQRERCTSGQKLITSLVMSPRGRVLVVKADCTAKGLESKCTGAKYGRKELTDL